MTLLRYILLMWLVLVIATLALEHSATQRDLESAAFGTALPVRAGPLDLVAHKTPPRSGNTSYLNTGVPTLIVGALWVLATLGRSL